MHVRLAFHPYFFVAGGPNQVEFPQNCRKMMADSSNDVNNFSQYIRKIEVTHIFIHMPILFFLRHTVVQWGCRKAANSLKIINNNDNNWILYSAFLVLDTTQSALQFHITPGHWIQYPALIAHLLNALGSILARHHFRGAHIAHQVTNKVCILPGTHLYTWVESSNVDKVSCWRTKVPGIDGIGTRNPLIQSQGFNPIYHGTSEMVVHCPRAMPRSHLLTKPSRICHLRQFLQNGVGHDYMYYHGSYRMYVAAMGCTVATRAVVFRLFQKTVILPPKPCQFSVNLYPILRHIFHPICINLPWIKHQSVNFLQSYKGFVVLVSLFPLIIFENVTEQYMIFINLMVVMISFTHVLKSSTIFLLHLELKPENGFKLKTGFDFRRSVSVRLTFWLQL